MSRGGKRENAGRKVGSVTVRMRETAEKALKEGLTPLEVMLNNMRFYAEGADRAMQKVLEGISAAEIAKDHPEAKVHQGDIPLTTVDAFRVVLNLRQLAGEAAKDAAAYCHARIAPADSKSKDDEEFVPLAQRLAEYEREEAIEASQGRVIPIEGKKKKAGK